MNPFRPILTGIHAAKVAGALFDLGIDVKRLDRAMAARLFEIEKETYGNVSAREAGLTFFVENSRSIPTAAYMLPMSRIDFLERATVIVGGWGRSGKLEASRAQGCVERLKAEIAR